MRDDAYCCATSAKLEKEILDAKLVQNIAQTVQ